MIIRIGRKTGNMSQNINRFIAGLLLLPVYIDLMGTLAQWIGFDTKITTYIYYGILWFWICLSVPGILYRMRDKALIVLVFGVLFALAQYMLFPENRQYLIGTPVEELIIFSPKTLVAVVPYTLIGLVVTDMKELRETLYFTAKVGVIMGVISYLVAIARGHSIHYDDMSNAYPICVMVCMLVVDYRKKDWVFATLGCLSLILAGTRGPLICVVVAVVFRVLIIETSAAKKIFLVSGGVLLIAFLQSGLLSILLTLISNGFNAIGVTNLRIIDYIREGMLLDSSGRDEIMSSVIEAIWANPIVGYGPGGDRQFIDSSYVHNLFLEMWVSYGIVVGTAILGCIFYWIIKATRSKDVSLKIIAIALFCSIVIKLFGSSSYLISKELFILLGICISGCTSQGKMKVV